MPDIPVANVIVELDGLQQQQQQHSSCHKPQMDLFRANNANPQPAL